MARKIKKAPKPNRSYELRPERRKHDLRILSLDPGSRNMGIACVAVKDATIDVVANSILTNPITSLVDNYMQRRELFLAELERWIDLYQPKAVVMERFQTRGNGGPLIELVSTMNAAVGIIDRDMQCKFITAATWKNKFNRRFDNALDDMYKECLTTPHQLDAILIGCYGLEVGLQKELSYTPEGIIKLAQATSVLPLRKTRATKE